MNQAEAQAQSQESFSFFQPIQYVPLRPPVEAVEAVQAVQAVQAVETVQTVRYIPPALPASFPSVTEPYLRKRTVHEVAHGVPFSEQKRFKPTQ